MNSNWKRKLCLKKLFQDVLSIVSFSVLLNFSGGWLLKRIGEWTRIPLGPSEIFPMVTNKTEMLPIILRAPRGWCYYRLRNAGKPAPNSWSPAGSGAHPHWSVRAHTHILTILKSSYNKCHSFHHWNDTFFIYHEIYNTFILALQIHWHTN